MEITSEKYIDYLSQIAVFKDLFEIPSALRKIAADFGWENVDLLMYSSDLENFYLPGEDRDELKNPVRVSLKKLIQSGKTISPAGTSAALIAMHVENQTNFTAKVLPLYKKIDDEFVGFLILASSRQNRHEEIEKNLELIKTLCQLALQFYYKNLEIKKTRLVNQSLQKELVRNENLKLLGEMIGGLTHDINNVLTGIIGFSQMIQLFAEDPDVLESISDVLTAANNGRDIISLISKTKKIKMDEKPKTINLENCAREAASNLASLLNRERPAIAPEKFFEFEVENDVELELKPTVCQQLFLHVYARYINSGAAGVTTKINKKDDRVEIRISPGGWRDRNSTPSLSKPTNGFPSSMILHQLCPILGFEFEMEEDTLVIDFYPSRPPEGAHEKVDLDVLKDLKILVFEPDKPVAGFFKELGEQAVLKMRIMDNVEDLKKTLPGEINNFDRVILDASALPIIEQLNLPPDHPPIIISTAWGIFLDEKMFEKSQGSRILLKPFTLQALKKALR